MKRLVIAVSIVALVAVAGGAIVLYQNRDLATVFCVPLDHGTRTRQFCVMNPFRNREAEEIAEQLLEDIKRGNTNVLIPYLADKAEDDRERYLNNEREHQITSWHNGEVKSNGDELSIQYWVERSNYPARTEEVHFFFRRTEGQWKLRS